jgi:hypothetical protein
MRFASAVGRGAPLRESPATALAVRADRRLVRERLPYSTPIFFVTPSKE